MDEKEITARLSLCFERDAERTYLASQYYKLPLQVLPPHYQDDDGTAFVYLLNPSGGIMQGDRLLTELSVGKGAGVVATTTASSKFYKMEDDTAVVKNLFNVASGAALEYIPEHSVPFDDTDVVQSNIFRVAGDSLLFVTDALTSGRKAKGESFGYTRFCSRTSIYVDDRIVLHDSMDIRPKEDDPKGLGKLEGNEVAAAVYIYGKGLAEAVRDKVREKLNPAGNTRVGVTAVNNDLAVIRLLADRVLDYKDTAAMIWACCRPVLLGKVAVRLRKY